MSQLNTIFFSSESDYHHRLIKSIFKVVGSSWRLEDVTDNAAAVDVVLVDCDTVKVHPNQLKNKMGAKLCVAYAPHTANTSEFDACLSKPIRSRELVHLLEQLQQMLKPS